MSIINVEIKARCQNPDHVRSLLKKEGAELKGIDHQVDTYFKVPNGRLKLRQGNIEQNLIFYLRNDSEGPKLSDIHLVPTDHPEKLHSLLSNALKQMVVVNKQRHIYFIDNIKFHIDEVEGLGQFVEIEAIDNDGSVGKAKLQQQCQHYMTLLEIKDEELIAHSYSDLLLSKGV